MRPTEITWLVPVRNEIRRYVDEDSVEIPAGIS